MSPLLKDVLHEFQLEESLEDPYEESIERTGTLIKSIINDITK